MSDAFLKTIGFPSQAEDPTLLSCHEMRRQTARAWLQMPAGELAQNYRGETGQRHRTLCSTGLMYQALPQADRALRHELCERMTQGAAFSPGALLAALLYLAPHEFPRVIEIAEVPDWLKPDYVAQMLAPPPLFRRRGEADAYRAYMLRWVSQLRDVIAADPRSDTGMMLAQKFGETSHFHALYFNAANVRDAFRLRAEILEMSLESINYPLDWTFPERAAGERIRLGVLALDFAPRSETFVTLPAFRDLDRSRFEIVLFCLRQSGSAMEKQCEQFADRLVKLPADLQAQVQTLRDADLDLLYLGANVTAAATDLTAIVLHRLARVQIAGICCCVTTGMRNFDCFLSGTLSETAEGQQHYTEKLYTIEGPAHCFDFGSDAPAPAHRQLRRDSLGIPRDAVVFASGANFHKILPELQDVWLRILGAVPESRLMLYPFNPNWDSYSVDAFMTRIAAALYRHGIDAQRIIVLDAAPAWRDVVPRLQLADIYLDSFPFCGATSLLDPLLAGLPTVAMTGEAHRTIQGAAILRSLGLHELIANNAGDYIRLALRLAANRSKRALLGKRIKTLMSASPQIFDHRRYAEKAGSAFEQMWQDYCDGRLGRKNAQH